MGLLQDAYRTYDTYVHLIENVTEGTTPLAPISHTLQNAQIEVRLTQDGHFHGAEIIPKEDSITVIPVTEDSASRTRAAAAHPLCDQLVYLTPLDWDKHRLYLNLISQWCASPHSHPTVQAVSHYIHRETLLSDLLQAGILSQTEDGTLEKIKVQGTEIEKCLVRWRVLHTDPNQTNACWMDTTLFQAFTNFYEALRVDRPWDISFISGERDHPCTAHPKGTLQHQFGAKLISANDDRGFTYRGRFTASQQANSVGYSSSQKAHNMLRWLAYNQGTTIGGRTFLCWNPDGKPVSSLVWGFPTTENACPDFMSYHKELNETLSGYRQSLNDWDDVVIASLDAATTGRLSATYYNVLKGSDFLNRIQNWYETHCIDTGKFGVQTPTIKQIITCAFGTQHSGKGYLEVDDRVLKEHIQRLFHCMIECQPIPLDVVHALIVRASTPLAYDGTPRIQVRNTACSAIRAHYNHIKKEEVFTLALDKQNRNRSYLFGRLLAVLEKIERDTYDSDEKREPNAIRMQSVFVQRPAYAYGILANQIIPYFQKLPFPGSRIKYRNLIDEILDTFDVTEFASNQKLEPIYLLGYSHQRNALYSKANTDSATDKI